MKKNRVFGVVGIGAKMANWNADFTTRPKTLPDGTIFGSDVAIKRSIRDAMDEMNEKIFYRKTMIIDKKKDVAKAATIEERFELLYGPEPKDRRETLKKLMEATDVRTFGVLYTGKNNIGFRGTVQFTQGLNVDSETEIVVQDITAPFSTAENESSTIGKKVFTDEAHYLYNFSLNPAENKEFIRNGWLNEDEVFSEKDYEVFKETTKFCATRINTAAKVACYNEFSLFVELKQESEKYLTDLASLITVSRNDHRVTYDITELLKSLVASAAALQIDKLEIYVDTNKVDLISEEIASPFAIETKSIFE